MNGIQIDADEYEHLLNCLANQKFIHEQTPEVQKDWQETIDNAWNDGMSNLSEFRKSKALSDAMDAPQGTPQLSQGSK